MNLRLRRHYKLLVLFVLVSVMLIWGLGDRGIVAYTAPGSEQAAGQTINDSYALALFDTAGARSSQTLTSSTDYE